MIRQHYSGSKRKVKFAVNQW